MDFKHPIFVIVCGLLLASIGFNILQSSNYARLAYKLEKLEAGPAKGLFLEPNIPKPNITDDELNELMKKILKKMMNERVA